MHPLPPGLFLSHPLQGVATDHFAVKSTHRFCGRTGFSSCRLYTEDEVILQGVHVAEVDFISKPFTVQGLQDKVRDVINRNGTHSSAASGSTERGA